MNNLERDVCGLILAGGFSRRMNADKSFLDYHGAPQVLFLQQLLGRFCAQTFISTRAQQAEQEGYRGLPQIHDLPVYRDKGPTGGIASAMTRSPNSAWLVLACDLPFVDDRVLAHLLSGRDRTKIATAFRSTHDGLPEPLCAVWEPQAKERIDDALAQGITCPRKILIRSDVRLLEQTEPHWLDNVNSPEEFASARKKIYGR